MRTIMLREIRQHVHVPTYLSQGNTVVYKVRMKKMEMADRVKVRLIAMGIRNSQSTMSVRSSRPNVGSVMC